MLNDEINVTSINLNILECKANKFVKSTFLLVCINLNILECKDWQYIWGWVSEVSINLNILECKDRNYFESLKNTHVLI